MDRHSDAQWSEMAGPLLQDWIALGNVVVRSRNARPGIMTGKLPWGATVACAFVPLHCPADLEDYVIGGAVLAHSQRAVDRDDWLRVLAASLDDDTLRTMYRILRQIADGRGMTTIYPDGHGDGHGDDGASAAI